MTDGRTIEAMSCGWRNQDSPTIDAAIDEFYNAKG
jgi:hypothetical protein